MNNYHRLNDDVVASPPPLSPPHCALNGRFVSLHPLMDDAEVFARLYECSHGDSTREAVWDFLPYGPFADARSMRENYLQIAAAETVQFYAVHHADGEIAGVASYLRINPPAHSIEIGHIWHAAHRQKGRANTETAYLLMDAAFAAGYRRLEWKCNALNFRSRLAALRLGLAFEGVFRRHTVAKGKNRDTAWFALLREDWPAAKNAIHCWLKSPPGEFSLTQRTRPLVDWSLPMHDFWTTDK